MTNKQPSQKLGFCRDRLPSAADYFAKQQIKLIGKGEWKSAICPFHDDTDPSLRVHTSGAFRCMACGAKGGDIIAFHQMRYKIDFIHAIKNLGAWDVRGAR